MKETMKASVLYGVGDYRLENREIPKLKEGEALVKVKAVGICGSDIPRIFVTGTYHFPTICGHEFAGDVVAVHDEVNKDLIGTRATIFPLIPCQECSSCLSGTYELCKNYNYLGSRCDGAFAEYVAVPVWNIIPIPDEVSYEEAAMGEPAAVSLHALRRSKIEVGETVVIFGPGTIGLLIASWAKIWGASRVLLVGTDNTNIDFIKSLGFEYVISGQSHDPIEWVMDMTNGNGADVAIEAVGTPETFGNCLLAAAPGGRVLAVGNPNGDYLLPKDTYWKILRKQLTIVGTWNSTYNKANKNDWLITVESMASKKLDVRKMITHRYSLDNIDEALKIMKDPNTFTNKVMIFPESEEQ